MKTWSLFEVCLKVGMLALVVVAPAIGCGGEPADMESKARLASMEDVGVVEHAVTYNGNDYLFVTTPKTWEQAQAYCRLSGYDLVTINDASEEAFLSTQESYRGLYNWWIGLNDRGIEGSWIWSSGSSGYTNWLTGEPNNYGNNEDCAVDRYSDSHVGGSFYSDAWNDLPCSHTVAFICERSPTPVSNRGSFSYSASSTSSATVNTYNHPVYLYAGHLFTVGTCGVPGASGSGDTYLRINNPSGQEIASNDDAGSPCGLFSNISIVIPATGTYIIRAGCFSSGSCSGTVAYSY